ncbi:MAG: hypothetical protein HYZ44_10230 [Bacteroidetes bacterium]|nr:hypothetical protein [Bacteroidota bacterium]
MSVKRTIPHSEGTYFITITCSQWLRLFEIADSYHVVYKWFDHLKSKGHYINAYVIMPNHFHALISFRNTGQSINTIIGNGKRFMAYDIVEQLKQRNLGELLDTLQANVTPADTARKKKHNVFEVSFDWKECLTEKFIEQKVNYIHENPCRGKWNLVNNLSSYVHSSAGFYLTGKHGAYEVTSYELMKDLDLTKL